LRCRFSALLRRAIATWPITRSLHVKLDVT
jgi:hypothetical protein